MIKQYWYKHYYCLVHLIRIDMNSVSCSLLVNYGTTPQVSSTVAAIWAVPNSTYFYKCSGIFAASYIFSTSYTSLTFLPMTVHLLHYFHAMLSSYFCSNSVFPLFWIHVVSRCLIPPRTPVNIVLTQLTFFVLSTYSCAARISASGSLSRPLHRFCKLLYLS